MNFNINLEIERLDKKSLENNKAMPPVTKSSQAHSITKMFFRSLYDLM